MIIFFLLACHPEVSKDTGASDAYQLDPFEQDHVIEVLIEIDPDDLAELCSQSRNIVKELQGDCLADPFDSPYTWFKASVTIEGEEFPEVAVRKKGLLGSESSTKPSFKINMDKYEDGLTWRGKDMLTFNNSQQDPTYMDQCLGYQAFRKMGIPAPRCSYAHVTVNGDDAGLFVHVESIRRDFWAIHYADNTGNHYEGTLSDFREGWTDTFDAKDGNIDSRQDLQLIVDAINLPDDELLEGLNEVIDLDEFYTFWATEVILGHWDGYGGNRNNFHIYRDPADNRFDFVPWGIDALFDSKTPFGEQSPISVVARSALTRRLYLHEEAQKQYLDHLKKVLDIWDDMNQMDELLRIDQLISPFLLQDEIEKYDYHLEIVKDYLENQPYRILTEIQEGTDWTEELGGNPCLVDVGSMQGTFETTWGSIEKYDPTAKAEFVVDYAEYHWEETSTCYAGEIPEGAFLGMPGLIGLNQYIYPYFLLSKSQITPGTHVMDWQGEKIYLLYIWDDQSAIAAYASDGELILNEAGTQEGDKIVGSFNLRLFSGQ